MGLPPLLGNQNAASSVKYILSLLLNVYLCLLWTSPKLYIVTRVDSVYIDHISNIDNQDTIKTWLFSLINMIVYHGSCVGHR